MRIFLGILLILFAKNCLACSIGWPERFTPSIDVILEEGENLYKEIMAPIVSYQVVRGVSAAGADCTDAGMIILNISMPEKSYFSEWELGFFTRIINKKYPNVTMDIPFSLSEEGTAVFPWLDGTGKLEIYQKIEVFAINHAMRIGPSTIVEISHPGRGKTANK